MTDGNSSGNEQCIWMRAGLVAYKLCDLAFDCEACLLDRALRGERVDLEETGKTQWSRRSHKKHVARVWGRFVHCEVSMEAFYDPGHTWARVEDRGIACIGMDDMAQQLAGPVYSIELPALGAALQKNDSWSIESAAGTFHFGVPLAGKVCWRNEKLKQMPSLINAEPYAAGAILAVEPFDLSSDLKDLYYGQRAQEFFSVKIQELNDAIEERLSEEEPSLGTTLLDGGELAMPLYELLQREAFVGIRGEFLSDLAFESSEKEEIRIKEGD